VKRRIIFGLAAFLLIGFAFAQTPGDRQPSVIVAPIENVQLPAGGSANLALDFRIGADFHINSNKPRADYLIPTILKLSPSEPVTVADVKYPAGEDMSFAFSPNEKLSVYSGDFSINTVLKAPANAAAGTYPVKGELRFQACDRSACYPPRSVPVQFQVSVVKK
jgi:Thiol:disulfide interchange protein DsbD, N-terminal